jgi:GMP synthase (glutamine-hydrolysing)
MRLPAEEYVAIIDFGSQYTQLIARRLRELGVYSQIFVPGILPDRVREDTPKGIVLSGGPASIYEPGAPQCDPGLLNMGIPVLGICYGMQVGCRLFGSKVTPARYREYGRASLQILKGQGLFDEVPQGSTVWMSHGDQVEELGPAFEVLATTQNCRFAAVRHLDHPFYGVQFHPEVYHTEYGIQILRNFLYKICGCKGGWGLRAYIEQAVQEIRRTVGPARVLCALSGGVDSSVTATLLQRAIGKRTICIFVDNGLLRMGEAERVKEVFCRLGLDLICVEAGKRFIQRLQGVFNPEQKRQIIGQEFIEVFAERAKDLEGVEFLAQGTLYPDVIESRSAFGGPSARIKTHHNVGGLPERLNFRLIEPLRYLFKDEVRELGRELGLPEEILRRQPFPGPGLAVRIIGEISEERLGILREADHIVCQEIESTGIHTALWQYFAILLPVHTVGVMGDERTYENVVALRVVESRDGMTADWAKLPEDLLTRISLRIVNEVRGVNRVVYDISSKPPSTIEWE